MKNTFIREFVIIVLMIITVSVVAKIAKQHENFNSSDAAGMENSMQTAETRSLVWFLEHRAEADALVLECRRNATASNTENCINAEYALKLAGK